MNWLCKMFRLRKDIFFERKNKSKQKMNQVCKDVQLEKTIYRMCNVIKLKNNQNLILFSKKLSPHVCKPISHFEKTIFNVKLRSDIRRTTCKPGFAKYFRLEKIIHDMCDILFPKNIYHRTCANQFHTSKKQFPTVSTRKL